MRRVTVAFGALGAVLAFVLPTSAGAQEDLSVQVLAVGWWSSSAVAVEQPDNGFQIAASPAGEPQSVAAIKISVTPAAVQSLPVRLTETAGFSEFGVLQVCTTTAAWTAEDPGALDAAPPPDCTNESKLTHTLDGVWLGDLAGLVPNGGEVSLVIVPVYQPPTPVGPGMNVTISKAELSAKGAAGAAPPIDDAGGFTVDPPAGGDVFFPSDGGGSFGVPATGDIGLDPAELVTTTTAAPAVTAPADDEFALDPLADEGGPPKPWGRLLVLVPLCAAFGYGSAHLRRFMVTRGFTPA